MSEKELFNEEPEASNFSQKEKSLAEVHTNSVLVARMYEDYFLDYASYVILERAIPSVFDGLKPVQRRLLHAMKIMDDGRYNKVANIIGSTMAYHPHGDQAIGDALVNMGQKDILIDCQGNWGDFRTGDGAAAPRYIEARLSKFALEVSFNGDTTEWQMSYDGRKKEPINLPVKFPLLLSQGTEGIAVGLSTKILPHNFCELILASIDLLKGKAVNILPDFPTGGMMDAREYNEGKRGGRVRVRAKIEQIDKKTLSIRDIPFGITTMSLIESILKASNKNKIKIKQVVDNTAELVDIRIELPPGTSPDVTIDALYAFTDCEVSISPICCVIVTDKPEFLSVNELLRLNTEHTKMLLKWELENDLSELQEKHFFASLEKIFIENRIYRDIEECEKWEDVISTIRVGLEPHVKNFIREVTDEDIARLTEIRIKRISKYNTFEADEYLNKLADNIAKTKHNLAHLVEYCIDYFKRLLDKYGKGRERKTQIIAFDKIEAVNVVVNNTKLYVNRADGFMGFDLKKDEFICECSDIDDIIVFRRDGVYMVTKIDAKKFVGKDILHIGVWRKGDERTTYNVAYTNLKDGVSYIKRFHVEAVTRDRDYFIGKDGEKAKVLYHSANPNGEAESIQIQLTPACTAKIKLFEFNFADLTIKGRTSIGNQLTKYPVRKVQIHKSGKSTLGGLKIWFDTTTGRLNTNEYGYLLGEFQNGDLILVLHKDGHYELTNYELTNRYDLAVIQHIEKFDPEAVISAIYYCGERKATFIKRFKVDTSSLNEKFAFVPTLSNKDSKSIYVGTTPNMKIEYKMKINGKLMSSTLVINDHSDVKGRTSVGTKFSNEKINFVGEATPEVVIKEETPPALFENLTNTNPDENLQVDLFGAVVETKPPTDSNNQLKIGDTIEF